MSRHLIGLLLAGGFLLPLGSGSNPACQPIISINVSSIEIIIVVGETHEETFDISNLGDEPLNFQLDFTFPGDVPEILMVDDDGGIGNFGSYTDIQRFYTEALDSAGFEYDYYLVEWSITPEQDGPDSTVMAEYGLVIWFTGETWGVYGNDTITPNDEVNLAHYLDSGGNLFFSSQDYFYSRYPSAGGFSPGQFPHDYLGVTHTNQDHWTQPSYCYGGDSSFAQGMEFFIINPYGSGGLWTDHIEGFGAPLITIDALPAALQYDSGNFKVAFTTLGLETLHDGQPPNTRAQFMTELVNWINQNPTDEDARQRLLQTDDPWALLSPESGTIEPGESQLITATFVMPDTAEPGDEYEGTIIINNNSPTDPVLIPVLVVMESASVKSNPSIPTDFTLYQNYPNPFNPTTTIRFDLPEPTLVTLIVYNILGEKTATLINQRMKAGAHQTTFDGSPLAPGMYFYQIHAGKFTDTKKTVLVK
jgi:hypothetical protein